jgi:hypothetical protein
MNLLLIPLCATLYRIGGWRYKWVRRYILPLIVYAVTHEAIQAVVLCAVLCFNLDEIEERDYDDVFCYGLAQAWCFAFSPFSLILALHWVGATWLSNKFNRYDWAYVEVAQGALIGALLV